MQLSFDLNFIIDPINFLKRYIDLQGYDGDVEVEDTAIHILLMQIYDANILDFTTSILCAAISIIAINLIEIHKLADCHLEGGKTNFVNKDTFFKYANEKAKL